MSGVVTHLERCSKLLQSTNGRDKVMKLFDYAIRGCNYYIATYDPTNKNKQLFSSLEPHLITARKLFFMGRWMEFLHALITRDIHQANTYDRLFACGKSLSFALWYIYDNMGYLTKVGVMDQAKAKYYTRKAATFWLVGLLFSIATTIRNFRKQHAAKNSKSPLQTALANPNLTLTLIRDVADLSVPIYLLELQSLCSIFVRNKAWLSAYGVLSSLIFIYQLY